MYSPSVTAAEQSLLESRVGSLVRYEPSYCLEVQEHLEAKLQKLADANPGLTPDRAFTLLTKDEQAFIRNERLLTSVDFHYWSRYAKLLPDASVSTGDLVTFEAWESQRIILDAVAQIEAEQYERSRRGEPSDGILIAVPKARQEGISLLAALLKMHRVMTSPYTLGVTATENEDKRTNLYVRDLRLHANLPWWLKPERTAPDIQAERLTFGGLDSHMVYQDYAQKSSLAAGEQYLVGHMSEVAQGDQTYIEKLMVLDYFPAIPQSWRSIHLLESTPAGMGGWWHPFVMEQYVGRGRWRVKFIPWYALRFKYSRPAPVAWLPSAAALEHAKKVELTSAEYMGRQTTLTREQLYWWETTREEYRKNGNLAYFLTNYPATLEESFQTAATSIFDIETIDFYRTMCREPGGVYEVIET
jgi:hypothetical protein